MMENLIAKAEVLLEALPYIQQFQGAMVLVKFGGSAMEDAELVAGAMRDVEKMCALLARVNGWLGEDIAGGSPRQTAELHDTLLVQRDALSAMLCQAEYAGEAGHGFTWRTLDKDAPNARDFAFETRQGETRAVPLRPLPEGGGWFETVWRRYLNGEVFD